MSDSLKNFVSHLPRCALHALASEESGRLKDMMLQLVQLADAFQDLLRDKPVDTPQQLADEASVEWEARADYLRIHAEYVMTGRALMPSQQEGIDGDNVVKLSERIQEASESLDASKGREGPPVGHRAEVISFRDRFSSSTLQ